MSWTLTIDCNTLDGTTPAQAGAKVFIRPLANLSLAGGELFGGSYTVAVDGTLSVTMPDSTVDGSVAGFELRRYFGGQSRFLIPVQPPGSSHALTEFLNVSTLPSVQRAAALTADPSDPGTYLIGA